MKTMNMSAKVFFIAAILLSYVTAAVAGFNYAQMLCAIKHLGASAPASVALITAVPFGIATAACLIAGFICRRK